MDKNITLPNNIQDWLEVVGETGLLRTLAPGEDLRMKEWFQGRYQIEKYLGMGGTSVAFLATDTILDRKITLKIWHRYYIVDSYMLNHEARVLSKINHPNIVKVFDFGDDDLVWMAIEYLGTTTLRSMLHERIIEGSILPFEDVLKVTLQIVDLIDYLHNSANVYQLDLKPANFAYEKSSESIKMMDFGSVIKINDGRTGHQFRYGTPGYIAPELITGSEVTPACDIFSLGIVLCEMLAGVNPFSELQSGFSTTNARDFFRTPISEMIDCRAIEQREKAAKERAEKVVSAMQNFNLPTYIPDRTAPKIKSMLESMLSFEIANRPLPYQIREEIQSYVKSNNELSRKPKVFISHSHKDKERFVNSLATSLNKRGFETWLDNKELLAGEAFWEKIGDAIYDSDFVLIVLSKNSIRSNGVSEELKLSQLLNLGSKVKIVPIRIDDISFEQIPYALRARQILDFVGWEDKKKFQNGNAKLASDMRALSQKV